MTSSARTLLSASLAPARSMVGQSVGGQSAGGKSGSLQLLLFSAGLLLIVGIVMIASASMDVAAQNFGDPLYFVYRQLIYVAIALLLGIVVANVPMSWWLRSGWLLLAIAFLALVLVLTPVGRSVNGSARWIPMGLFNIQVSEIAKICIVAYLAGYLVRRREEMINTWIGFLKPLLVLGIASVLLVVEPDFGATVVLMGAAMGMLFLSGIKLWRFAPLLAVVTLMGTALVVFQPYRMKRVVSYLDPWKDQFDSGYQLTQSLIAFGRGDWFGVGLGNSVQKLFFLPEAHTDFVFAIIAEEWGLIGAVAVVLVMALMVMTGLRIAKDAESAGMRFAASFGYGISLIIALQAVINLGVSTGLLPTKGLTLPLVSYGGSSLMITCMSIAILLRIEMERLDALVQQQLDQLKGKGRRPQGREERSEYE